MFFTIILFLFDRSKCIARGAKLSFACVKKIANEKLFLKFKRALSPSIFFNFEFQNWKFFFQKSILFFSVPCVPWLFSNCLLAMLFEIRKLKLSKKAVFVLFHYASD